MGIGIDTKSVHHQHRGRTSLWWRVGAWHGVAAAGVRVSLIWAFVLALGATGEPHADMGCAVCGTDKGNWIPEEQQKACMAGDLGVVAEVGLEEWQDPELATVVLGADIPRVVRGARGGRLHARVLVVEEVDKWWAETRAGAGIGADTLGAALTRTRTTHLTRAVLALAGVPPTDNGLVHIQWNTTTEAAMGTRARVRAAMQACDGSCAGVWTGPVAKVWSSGSGVPRMAAALVDTWVWEAVGVGAASTVDDLPWVLSSSRAPVLGPALWDTATAQAWVGSGSGVAGLRSVLVTRCARVHPGTVCGVLARVPGFTWGLRGALWTSRCVQSMDEAATAPGPPPCTCGSDSTGAETGTGAGNTLLTNANTWRPALGAPLVGPCSTVPLVYPRPGPGPGPGLGVFPGPLRVVVVFVQSQAYGAGAPTNATGPSAALAQMTASDPVVDRVLQGLGTGVPVVWVHGNTVDVLPEPGDPSATRVAADAAANATVTAALGHALGAGWAGQPAPGSVVGTLLGLGWAQALQTSHLHVTAVVGLHDAVASGAETPRGSGSDSDSEGGVPGDTTGALVVTTALGTPWRQALPLVHTALAVVEGSGGVLDVEGGGGAPSTQPCTLTSGGVQLGSEEAGEGSGVPQVGVSQPQVGVPQVGVPQPPLHHLDVSAAVPGVGPDPTNPAWTLVGHHVVVVVPSPREVGTDPVAGVRWGPEVAAMQHRYAASVGNRTAPWVVHVLPPEPLAPGPMTAFGAGLVREVVRAALGPGTGAGLPRMGAWVPHVPSLLGSASWPGAWLAAIVVDVWTGVGPDLGLVPRGSGLVPGSGLVAVFEVGSAGLPRGPVNLVALGSRDLALDLDLGVGNGQGLQTLMGFRDGVVHTCVAGSVTGVQGPPCGPLVDTWVGEPPVGLPAADTLYPPWFSTGCAYPVQGASVAGPPPLCQPAALEAVSLDADPGAVERAVLQRGIRCAEQDLGPLFLPEGVCTWGPESTPSAWLRSPTVAAVACTPLSAEEGVVWGLPCALVCTGGLDPASNCTQCPSGSWVLGPATCLPCAQAGPWVGCLAEGTARVDPGVSGGPCACVCREGWTGANCTGCPPEADTGQPRVWAGACVDVGQVCGPHGQWVPGDLWPAPDPGDWTCVCAQGWRGVLCDAPPEGGCQPGTHLATGVLASGAACECDDPQRVTAGGGCRQCVRPLVAVDTVCVSEEACRGTGGVPLQEEGWCVFGVALQEEEAVCPEGFSLQGVCLPCPAACVVAGGLCDPSATLGCRCPWGAAFDPVLGCGVCPLGHVAHQGACVLCEPCVPPWGTCGPGGVCTCAGNRSVDSACTQCLPGFAAAAPGSECLPCEGAALVCGAAGVCVVGPRGRADTCQCSGPTRNVCDGGGAPVPHTGCCAACAPGTDANTCAVCTPACGPGAVCMVGPGGPACACLPPGVMRADGAQCVGPWVPPYLATRCEVVFSPGDKALDVGSAFLLAFVCVAPFLAGAAVAFAALRRWWPEMQA